MSLLKTVFHDLRNIPDAFAWNGVVPGKRNISLDFLKLIACAAVVTLHCLRKSSSSGMVSFHPYLYYACRFAIPVFFMINGFFQLHKQNISWAYTAKKTLLISVIVLGWVTFCNILKLCTGHGIWWPDYWRWIWQGGNFSVFWYFGAFIFMMVSLPILARIFHHRKLRYTVMAILLAASVSADAYSLYRIHNAIS